MPGKRKNRWEKGNIEKSQRKIIREIVKVTENAASEYRTQPVIRRQIYSLPHVLSGIKRLMSNSSCGG